MSKLLRINEVAEILKVSRWRAYELARIGRIPVVRIGRQVRVNAAALDAWIEAGGSPLDEEPQYSDSAA